MRVHYKVDGNIYKVLTDAEVFYYDDPYGLALPYLQVDEIDPANKAICIDLLKMHGRLDVNHLHKYYIALPGVQLMERIGWEEDFSWMLQ